MNLSKVNRHKESIHCREKKDRCQYCGIQEEGRADLKLHIKQNHEDGKYKPKLKCERTLCNVCCRSFNDKQYLESTCYLHMEILTQSLFLVLCVQKSIHGYQ